MKDYFFTVAIPGQPPSVNRLTELHVIGGKRRKAWSAEFYAYRDEVALRVQQARPKAFTLPLYRPKEGRGLLKIEIVLELAHDIDCDNILKPLLDGVKTGLGQRLHTTKKLGPHLVPIFDDAGFLPQFIGKKSGLKEPCVRMRIGWA